MRELCPWYALTVKNQHEKAVRSALEFKGFEAFSPVYKERRQWSDRVKQSERPLFSGYVFCRFAFEQRIHVLDTPGVGRIVGFGGKASEIPEEQIAAIQTVAGSKLALRPWPFLRAGDRVRIERGPLRGIEGVLIREKDSLRLVIGIEMLQRAIAVELEPEMIVPLRARPAFA
jgi:transcription antitermination factor NusG